MQDTPYKSRFIYLITNRHPEVQTGRRPCLYVHHSIKRKERQFYQNYRSFMADRVGFVLACGLGQSRVRPSTGRPFNTATFESPYYL